jgi:hypothetical protein
VTGTGKTGPYPRWVKVTEVVAELEKAGLGKSGHTIRRWCRASQITGARRFGGGIWMIPGAWLYTQLRDML